jgi:hypothetical protein
MARVQGGAATKIIGKLCGKSFVITPVNHVYKTPSRGPVRTQTMVTESDMVLTIVLCMLAWQKLPDMPASKAQHACESCGGSLYVAAGGCDGLHVSTMYRYDFAERTWFECAPAPSRVQSPVMRCVNGKLYFIGGHDSTKGAAGGKTGVCGEYDPDTDCWTLKAPMPTAREDMGSAVIGREIWVFGGLDNRGHYISPNVEVYDTVSDTWTVRAEWPNPRCLGDFACRDGRAVYLMCGTTTMDAYPWLYPDLSPQVYEDGLFYDLPPMPNGHCYTEVELLDGIIYVFGGAVTNLNNCCDTVDRFDVHRRVWLTPLKMPYVANSLAATQHRGRLYVTGGWRDGQFLRDFYVMDRPLPAMPVEVRYGGGHGTAADPYQIRTAEQLAALSNHPADWDKAFRLMADIDLTGYDGIEGRPAFRTIAPDTDPNQKDFQGTPFAGTFDGDGHAISHLTVAGTGSVGLFGLLTRSSRVADLALADVSVMGSGDCVGGLAGLSQGTVDHCCSSGVVSGSGAYVGGLVGSNAGLLSCCWSIGLVTGGGNVVGGLVGANVGDIDECAADGAVIGGQSVGGLVGQNWGWSQSVPSAGSVAQPGTILDCASRSSVRGEAVVGGLVGDDTHDGMIYCCYSAGAIIGNGFVGGLVGIGGGRVALSFWDIQASGQRASAGGVGLATDGMLSVRTFLDAGWDFTHETNNGNDDTWWMPADQDYPRLVHRAVLPKPYDGADDVLESLLLCWAAGDPDAEYDIYFGEDEAAVVNATPEDPSVYRGRQPAGTTAYDPGSLDAGKTYYWRIDTVHAIDVSGPARGRVWRFSEADFIFVRTVDDFEAYTDDIDTGSAIFQTWIDGLGLKPAIQGNSTGSLVGNLSEPFAEEDIVHSGHQSMAMSYDNVRRPWFSQAERTWETPQDWTTDGADTLTLYFHGEAGNDPDPLYVSVADSSGRTAVVVHSDADATLSTQWHKWHIPLTDVQAAGADPGAVTKLYIGVGRPDESYLGGRGRIYIDDIRLTNHVH